MPRQSTYNSFCDDRGSLVATPPPPKRNKRTGYRWAGCKALANSSRNRSEVPLGSLETSSIIKAGLSQLQHEDESMAVHSDISNKLCFEERPNKHVSIFRAVPGPKALVSFVSHLGPTKSLRNSSLPPRPQQMPENSLLNPTPNPEILPD